MNKLVPIVLAGIAGAAIWRRKGIRDGAGKASKAVAGAADSARSRPRPGQEDQDEVDDVAAEPEVAVEPDVADSKS